MQKDTLYVIDLDRTLIDVEKVMKVTQEVCGELGVDFEKIYKDQQDLSKRGTAYSPFKYISSYTDLDIENFKSRFIELSAEGKILFPDAIKFLEALEVKQVDKIILTHGADDNWQILKLQAANLTDIPYRIVKSRYKGRLIKGWIDHQRLISPSTNGLGQYRECVFVDDRAEAFIDIPGNCRGFLLDRQGKYVETIPELPRSVRMITSLSEIQP